MSQTQRSNEWNFPGKLFAQKDIAQNVSKEKTSKKIHAQKTQFPPIFENEIS